METQLELIPLTKHIPQWLADYFYKANAGSYKYKQDFYTHIKPFILKSFGEFVGYDLQTIEHKCFSCQGTGTYKEYYWEGGMKYLLKKEKCWNCIDGIYSTKQIPLQRYLLNGKIYHIPTSGIREGLPYIPSIIINKFNGLIQHENIDTKEAFKAYMVLLWMYNKPMFYNQVIDFIDKKTNWVSIFVQSLFRKDNTRDELPF